MKQMVKLTCLILLQLASFTLYSQKYATNWHINDFDLIFNDDTVDVKLGISIHPNKGAGIISDASGKLLFYSDGQSVWNKNHDLMPNGGDLNIMDGRTSLVVPKPGSESLYYIFTAEGKNGPQDPSGLYYSVIDMGLDNGLGDVTEKGIKLIDNTTYKLSATFHSNNKDVWVLVQQYGSNRYYSILITNDGISNTFITSDVGLPSENGFADPQLKFSPDGEKVASGYSGFDNHGVDLFDFNASTGSLTKPMGFLLPTDIRDCEGLEFSSDASKLYVLMSGSIGEARLLQYDLADYNQESIGSSMIPVLIPDKNDLRQLQLASNGKIYFTKGGGDYSGTEYLGVINSPNEAGISCGAVENGLYLEGGSSFVGRTPDFIQSYFFRTNFLYDNTCQASPVHFKITNESNLDSVRWYFGEGSTSTSFQPGFVYDEAGEYNVQLLAFYPEKCDTIIKQININPFTAFDLGNDSTVCLGYKLMINQKFESYLWNNGDTLSYNYIETEGWYKATVTNNYGCSPSFGSVSFKT